MPREFYVFFTNYTTSSPRAWSGNNKKKRKSNICLSLLS